MATIRWWWSSFKKFREIWVGYPQNSSFFVLFLRIIVSSSPATAFSCPQISSLVRRRLTPHSTRLPSPQLLRTHSAWRAGSQTHFLSIRSFLLLERSSINVLWDGLLSFLNFCKSVKKSQNSFFESTNQARSSWLALVGRGRSSSSTLPHWILNNPNRLLPPKSRSVSLRSSRSIYLHQKLPPQKAVVASLLTDSIWLSKLAQEPKKPKKSTKNFFWLLMLIKTKNSIFRSKLAFLSLHRGFLWQVVRPLSPDQHVPQVILPGVILKQIHAIHPLFVLNEPIGAVLQKIIDHFLDPLKLVLLGSLPRVVDFDLLGVNAGGVVNKLLLADLALPMKLPYFLE